MNLVFIGLYLCIVRQAILFPASVRSSHHTAFVPLGINAHFWQTCQLRQLDKTKISSKLSLNSARLLGTPLGEERI